MFHNALDRIFDFLKRSPPEESLYSARSVLCNEPKYLLLVKVSEVFRVYLLIQGNEMLDIE